MEMYVDELQNQPWFQRIMKSEGGLNRKEPASVGGISYAGISQKAYEAWVTKKAPKSLSNIPANVEGLAGNAVDTEWEKVSPLEIPSAYGVRVDVITAFYKDYFTLARLDVVPPCLQYIHADFFVNAKFNANKILQRMCGFTGTDVDGILGPASRAKVVDLTGYHDEDDLIMQYHEFKLKHYHSLRDVNVELYNENIKGWTRRAQHVLSELEEYFADDEPTTSALDETEDDIDLFADEHELLGEPEVEEKETDSLPIGSPADALFGKLEQRIDRLEQSMREEFDAIEAEFKAVKDMLERLLN